MAHCPEAERLAAYLDGQLFPEQRERLEEHLAGCDSCANAIAEAMRFEALTAPANAARTGRWLPAAAMAVVAVPAVLWLAFGNGPPLRSDPRAPLIAATAENRPLVPRLTGGFQWARLTETTRGLPRPTASTDAWRYYAAAEAVRESTESSGRADSLGALADAHLLVGDVESALATLGRATAARPADPSLQSDLAAAYLARGIRDEAAADIAAAFELASTAHAAAPDLLEARFNQALAFQQLGLRVGARTAWTSYLAAETDPRWAAEARARLTTIAARRVAASDPALRQAAATGNGDLATLVAAHRFAARRLVEHQLLREWGEARLAGDAAEAPLAAASAIARLYRQQTGDSRLEAQVQEIVAARSDDALTLAAAHRDIARGELLLENGDWLAGEQRLKAAAVGFPAGSVGHSRAIVELEAVRLVSAGPSDALIDDIERGLASRNDDPVTRGRLSQARGLAAALRGRPAEAIGHYLAAIAAYQAVGEEEPTIWLSYLLGEVYSLAGDPRTAWRYRAAAIAGAGTLADDPRRAQNILLQTATSCLLLRQPRLASALLDEAAHDGEALRSYQLVGLHLRRAQVALQLDDPQLAAAEIGHAAVRLAAVDSPAMRRRLIPEIAAIRGATATSPSLAVAASSRALEGFRALGQELRLPGLLLQRAQALRAGGDPAAAARDLGAGISALEAGSPAPQDRLWLDRFDGAGRLYDEMAAAALASGRQEQAFAWLERGRAHALEAAVAVPPVGLAELRDALDAKTVVLSYAVVNGRALLWRAAHGDTRLIVLPTSPAELASASAVIDADLAAGTWSAASDEAAARLYGSLVAPAGLGDAERRLVIIPDRTLESLPFAALAGKRHRFLMQEHVVEMTPSAGFFVHAQRRQRALAAGGSTAALVLGDPQLDDRLFPGLQRLPGAAKEVRAVAALYDGATVATGHRATRQALLATMGDHSIVHLATHALVDDALPSRSALALAPLQPGDGTGALYAEEVRALSLPRTRTVVLAACGSGRHPLSGTAGRLSLAHSFLAADVPTVVAALWPVGDQRSVALLTALHSRLSAGDDAATALRWAQLRLLASPDPALRSPATWALFQALGG